MEQSLMFDFKTFYDNIANTLPTDCRIMEIGVADGESALYLAKKMQEINKSFKLYMVDNLDYGKFEQLKTIYQNIIKSGLGDFIEVIPYDSLTASAKFNDNYLDFIFLDSSHEYQETKDSIRAWFPKVKDLGIFAGHDYFLYRNDVGKAVDELIPRIIQRNDIPGREFEPEPFLQVEDTDRGYGLWWCKKDFYKSIL